MACHVAVCAGRLPADHREDSFLLPGTLHLCRCIVYLGDEAFELAFQRCDAAGLVWVNPRFEGGPAEFASAATREEALRCGQFRLKDLRDPGSGELCLVLEHEVRSTQHKSFPCCQSMLRTTEGSTE